MWSLLWANLSRKRLRLTLTLASIAVAFILFSLVEALQYAFVGGVNIAGQDRLMTMDKISFTQPLPRNYLERIRSVPGVRSAIAMNWFGGYFRDEKTQVFSYPVLGEQYLLDIYPEVIVRPDEFQAWLRDRTGALVGRSMADAMKWKVGDVVPIRSAIYFKKDGSNTWDMRIDGIFDNASNDTNGLYFHYDYFNEAIILKDYIGWVGLKLADKNRATQVAAQIDALFANSPAETKTNTEKAFVQSFANQLGNISAIVTVIVVAVLFTLLLVTANSMAQSVRERTSEIGVMKTLGFSSMKVLWLVMAESLLVMLIGGALGLLLGAAAVSGIARVTRQYLPLLMVPPSAYALAIVCLILLGTLSGALPCWQAYQLKITDALRRS
jgi:putative ABC transport system permease protein